MKLRPRVLFISYNSLIEPLGRTQIVPYVRALSTDYRMTVLSFEKPVFSPHQDSQERRILRSGLESEGIRWIELRYHKRPSLPATLWDIGQGIGRIRNEHGREPFAMIHARGYVPAAIAWGLKRLLQVPYLFDIRGLQAEEYQDAGHWNPQGLRFRLTKWMEQKILRDADGVVTLTEAIRPVLRTFPGLTQRLFLPPWEVIPTCVDLEHFSFRESGRERIRAWLRVGDRPILVYAGSVGTWYLLEEMLSFYQVAAQVNPGFFFLILVNGSFEPVRSALHRHGIVEGPDASIQRVRFEEMPDWLSAADAGIAFIRSCPSKRSSSPTKYAEYLACGLPLVVNAGVGDVDALLRQEKAGVLVKTLDSPGYRQAALELSDQLGQERESLRQVAQRHFSLHQRAGVSYRRLYEKILSKTFDKKVLFLTPYPPHCAPSQRLKFEQYYPFFEEQGVRVVVSPFVNKALWRILYRKGHWLRKITLTSWGILRRLLDFIRAGRFDAVYLHLWAIPMGPPWFEEGLARRRLPLVYDIDDLVYLPQASQANLFMRRFRKENQIARIMRVAQQVIVCTEYLRHFALRYNLHTIKISSTINTELYQPRSHHGQPQRITIGWSGSLSTSRYLHLLDSVLRELSRRFEIRLLVIGDSEFRMEGVKVEARPWKFERETADLGEMDIGLYPLPNEEWVLGKSGLKALQYMGMGVPVVASAIGAAREFIRDGDNGFLAGSWEEWIDRLSRLIGDPSLRQRMGLAGRATVEASFSVKVTAPVYLKVIRSLWDDPALGKPSAGVADSIHLPEVSRSSR